MKRETLHDYLLRRLGDLKGYHNRMAIETGVGQATVSRIYLQQAVPRLNTAQALFDWIEKHDLESGKADKRGLPAPSGIKSARRIANARGRVSAAAH